MADCPLRGAVNALAAADRAPPPLSTPQTGSTTAFGGNPQTDGTPQTDDAPQDEPMEG